MQKEKTLQFWDDAHRSERVKEWIVEPSDALMQRIVDQIWTQSFPSSTIQSKAEQPFHSLEILEIGCGMSTLSRDLCDFWSRTSKRPIRLNILATDVSPVCIRQQQDIQVISQTNTESSFMAKVIFQELNITRKHPECHGRFDMILDKGCLDTCLFRSKNPDRWVSTVLDNIHSWLRSSDSSYCIISPRSKLIAMRDHGGFSVNRTILDSQTFVFGALELRKNEKDRQYLYICQKTSEVERKVSDLSALDFATSCAKCGVQFQNIMIGKVFEDHSKSYWLKRWDAHQRHCKTPHR